jgi:hypothetical protein
MYLNQFRAFKIAMMGNVIGVPQNMEYVFSVTSVKKVENHCARETFEGRYSNCRTADPEPSRGFQ